jgi:hypothetical protein
MSRNTRASVGEITYVAILGLMAFFYLLSVKAFESLMIRVPSAFIKRVVGRVYDRKGPCCYKCGVLQVFVDQWHTTPQAAHPSKCDIADIFGTGYYSWDADSPLCQSCWAALETSEARLPYYTLWIDNGLERVRRRLSEKKLSDPTPVPDFEVRMAADRIREWIQGVVISESIAATT